jgi:hypothetical protein
MSKQAVELRAVVAEIIREKLPIIGEKYESRKLEDPLEIKRARQLATQVFARLGKISPEDLDDEGILKHDVILPISTFFGTFEGDKLSATGRLLWDEDTTIDNFRMPIDNIDQVHADFLRDQPAGSIAEIGSLAKADGSRTVAVLKTLREMWTFADRNEITTFTCGLEPNVLARYEAMFGAALTLLSEETVEFPGIHGQQVPIMIDVRDSVHRQRGTQHKSVSQRIERAVVGPFITRDSPSVKK